MDCKIFRKRLNDLIEDNICYDLKDAMLEHITECEVCRALYEEELSIDETIRAGLSVDPRSFKSSRAEIMKSIDKNKYGTSPMKKFINHLRKYRGTYTSVTAVIVAAIFITPYISRNGISFGAKKSAQMPIAQFASKAENESASSADLKKVAPEVQAEKKVVEDNTLSAKSADSGSYNASFEKKPLDKSYNPSYNTAWEYSGNKKYSAAVEGRGEASQDEGVATIVVKKQETGEQWAFSLLDNEMQQMSPRFVHWVDDENLLVIVGLAQGHASLGGQLYMLNINSLETKNADPENKAKLQNGSVIMKVVSAKALADNQLEIAVEVSVYDDNIQNNYHKENRTIVVPFK